ncbi:MAG: NAD-dependent epimerase/dehydratase family protein [Cytophagales bacterium]|nr:NAD-dependent epimerase/dehydratase family protein [Cytophagales bacterium]
MSKRQSRREFIELSVKTGVAASVLPATLTSCESTHAKNDQVTEDTSKQLSILILGGTSFLGPHQIAYAIDRGHAVSTFTRGKTKPTVNIKYFDQVEQLIGDREDDLTALENRKWDVVIDNSGRRVEWTQKSASLLKENCGLYLYTSSTGVFFPYLKNDHNESDEVLLAMPEGVDEDIKPVYDYGIMKANSELAAISEFGEDRAIIVRPTYMIGPADRTNRFIHWPIRLSQGGEIMVPGKETDLVQYVDVRDVAEWMIRLAEEKKSGTYNAVGPKSQQNIHAFVEEAATAFETESSFVKIDNHDFLKTNGVEYIVPWIMPTDGNQGSAMINNEKAIKNGLSFRPLPVSVKDTYDWWYSDAVSQERRDEVAIDPNGVLSREASIIEKWKARG